MQLIIQHEVSIRPESLLSIIYQTKLYQFLTYPLYIGLSMLTEVSQDSDILLRKIYPLSEILSEKLLLTVMANI